MLLGISTAMAGVPGGVVKKHAHGLRPPTAKERAWDRTHLIVTQSVALNQRGLDRVNAERAAKNMPLLKASVAPTGSEVSGLTAEATEAGQVVAQATAPAALPTFVDNSASNAFPPIGNQGSVGECCPYACGYYTMTYMVSQQLGINAKTGGVSTWFSPKFLYNLVNDGYDGGSWITQIYQVEQEAGAPYQSIWPQDSNVTAWPTSASVWRSAIPYRMGATGVVNDVGSASGLKQLKTMLADGYVLNVGTDIDSWHFTTVGSYSGDSTYAGQAACNFTGGPFDSSAHCVTIVGYDDTMWIDVNGNGKVDTGELGAFKIANQYSTTWENSGYAWISYDALKATTAVTGWTGGSTRETAFWYNQAYWINARPAYTPKVLGQFVINTADRSTLLIQPGTSSTGTTFPTSTASSVFFYPDAGELGYSGTTTASTATLVMDYTDIASAGALNYYLEASCASTSETTTISSFQLTDASGNVLGTATNNIPITITGYDSIYPYLSYAATDTTPPAAVTNLGDNADTPTSITVTWTAPGSDGASGLAASYRLACSTSPITASNFSSLTPAANMAAPQAPGSTETYQFSNLTPGTTYYFALTTTDSSGNTSALSNVFSDATPTTLSQATGTLLTSGTAGIAYTATFSASGGTTAYGWSLPPIYTESNPGTGTTTLPSSGSTDSTGWNAYNGVWDYTFPTGFTFPMAGTSYSSVEVSESGYLDFSHSTQDSYPYTTDFTSNPFIAAYFQATTSQSPSPNDIYVSGSSSQVAFLWSGLSNDGTTIDVQATLYPNGQILLTYGAAAVDTGYEAGNEIIGVSSGDGTDYTYSGLNNSANIPINTQRLFTPASLPAGLTLNATTGVLSGTPTTSGTYTFPVRVTDASYPAQTSTQTYTLVVAPNTALPSITLQPASKTIDQGQTATFTTASTGGNLIYQWKFNGVNLTNSTGTNTSAPGYISGATTATLTIASVLGPDAGSSTSSGTYTCYVSNPLGNATTNGAVLTVNSGPIISIISPGTNAVSLPGTANSLALIASATSPITTPTVTWSVASGPGTVTFSNANAASTSAAFSATGTYVLQATASDGTLSSSTSLIVGVGVSVASTGSTLVDQLSFNGSDGAGSTSTIGGSTWTVLSSAESTTSALTSSAATALLNLKTSSNASSGIEFTWTNSFNFSNGRGDDGTSSSGTATDGLSTYTPTGTSATSGVTFTNGSKFFPWSVMQSFDAVHDKTDGYASFKLSSSTPLAYTFWIASSYAYQNPASNAWPTLINIGGTYSETNASFTGGTTLSLEGAMPQSSDTPPTQLYQIGVLSTPGGFLSTYNPSTGLYDLNVQIGSGTNSTSTGAALNGIIFQAVPTYTTHSAPQVSPGTIANPVPGTAISLAGSVSDGGQSSASNLTTIWSLASGPANVSFANASSPSTTVTFPQGGTYTLTLSASDGIASAFQNLTVAVPYIPVISSGSSLGVATTGSAFSFQIAANDGPTSYSATGLPAGLTINSTTGVISGTPTVTGVFNVTIYATNSSGTGTSTMTLTVNSPTDTPTMPQWALIFLGGILFAFAIRSMPGARCDTERRDA